MHFRRKRNLYIENFTNERHLPLHRNIKEI